jgi:hypothetical protein
MTTNQNKPADRGVGRPKKHMKDRKFQLVLTQNDISIAISGADIIAYFQGSPLLLMHEINEFLKSKTSPTDGTTTH